MKGKYEVGERAMQTKEERMKKFLLYAVYKKNKRAQQREIRETVIKIKQLRQLKTDKLLPWSERAKCSAISLMNWFQIGN
jgi:uncharacterized protein YegL